MENTQPAKTEKQTRYHFFVRTIKHEYVAELWLTLPEWFLPVVGDDIRFLMTDEPMPSWVETSEKEWKEIGWTGFTIIQRSYSEGQLQYVGKRWK